MLVNTCGTLMVLFCIFCYALGQGSNSAQCHAGVFQSLPQQGLGAATLLYSLRGTPCDTPYTASSYMNCGTGSGATYTTLSFAMATTGPGGTEGVCANFTVDRMAPSSVACFRYYQPPTAQATAIMEPLYIGVALTRAFIYYPLTLLGSGASNVVPFTYAQFGGDSNATDFCASSINTSNTCLLPAVQQQNTNLCDASYIASTWGDVGSDAAVVDQCGPLSDPPQEILEAQSNVCKSVCCTTCNNSGTATSNFTLNYRRWAVGPAFQIYRPGPPQLRVFGAMVVSKTPNLAEGEYVTFQAPVNGGDGEISFEGGLQSNQDYLSILRHVRVRVNQWNRAPAALRQLDGYLALGRYAEQTSAASWCDMGASNPYATAKQPSPCLSAINTTLAARAPQVVPPNASPQALGAGLVPTQSSLGNRSACSFFWLPSELATAGKVIVPNPQEFNVPVATQPGLLWPQLTNPTSSVCPGTNGDPQYFQQYQGLPGWQREQPSGEPLVKSICQMSNEVNAYAQAFLGYFNNEAMGNVTLAIELAGPPPPSLVPTYNIGAPNVWVHDQSLVVDVGLTYPAYTGYEVLLQLAAQTFVHQVQNQYLYSVVGGLTRCTGDPVTGLGTLMPVLTTIASASESPGLQGNSTLRMNCTTIQKGPGTVWFINGTNSTSVPNSSITVNLLAGTTQNTGVFQVRFPPSTLPLYTALQPPFLSCTLELLSPDLKTPYGETVTVGCVTEGNVSQVHVVVPEQPESGSKTALYIGLAVAGGAVLILGIVGIIVALVTKTKEDTSDATIPLT